MAINYELSPSPELPYRIRVLHWPQEGHTVTCCFVIAKDEERAREIAEAKTGLKAWLDSSLTQARQVNENEYFMASS